MKLAPIIALAALVATPAFAGQAKKKMPMQPQGYYQQHGDWRASRNQHGGNYINGPSVYSPTGRYIGSDPSLSVRQQMYDEDFRFRSGT